MGIFSNLLFKKNKDDTSNIEVVPATEKGVLGEAEQIANVVTAGLEKANYSEMNQTLTSIVPLDSAKEEYVFSAPGVLGTYLSTLFCVILATISIYFLFIGAATILLSSQFDFEGTTVGTIALTLLTLNALKIKKNYSVIRFEHRFNVYEDILPLHSMCYVEDISVQANTKPQTVVKDLNKAIKQKLVPQGHFSQGNLVFMTTDEAYRKYKEKPAVYDRYFQKQLDKRERERSRTKHMNEIIESGELYIQKLNGYNALIKEKSVSEEIDRLITVTKSIFYEIDMNPSQVQSLGVFLNYYLPTTEKLFDTYTSLIEKKTATDNQTHAKKEIEKSLSNITRAFESILERLYMEHDMEVSSEIDALEITMKRDGLI